MKDYTRFTAEELAQDEDFLQWVQNPGDEELDEQWRSWLMRHPEKVDVVIDAKRMIKAVINERQYSLHDDKQQEMWSRIHNTVSASKKKRVSKLTLYSIAASLVLILISGIAILYNNYIHADGVKASAKYSSASKLLKYVNESELPQTLVLQDGSSVVLQPHSVIQYPEKFSTTHRDVYLSGAAFFEVTRNPQKPFSVYASEIVTQVLGTSFTVRAYEKERDVIVSVKTGKVSVLTKAENFSRKNNYSQNLAGTLLTPNQQIVFSKDEERMIKTLVNEPIALPSAVAAGEKFQFIDTPIREVFNRLEKAYGVQIIFDEEVMSNCYLNISFDNISFYEKLRLICKGINAKYEILDAHIIITGTGCQ